jgi:uroporphyrinogen-III synthase
MASIFISRSPEKTSLIQKWCTAHGHTLFSMSCIETQPIFFELNGKYDWIFFSSSEGVKHFFSQISMPILPKMAAMGPGTAQAIDLHGISNFIGETTDPKKVAQDFKQQLKSNDRVLFPVGKKSHRSIPQYLGHSPIDILEVYDTMENSVELPSFDLYIFSSPSNVHSFLKQNHIPDTSVIISFGPTTSKALKAAGYETIHEIQTSSVEHLLDTIKSNLCS